MDKTEKLLRDILKEQRETNRLLKRMDRQSSTITITDGELEAFKELSALSAESIDNVPLIEKVDECLCGTKWRPKLQDEEDKKNE